MRACATCSQSVRPGAPFCPHCGGDLPDDLAEVRDPLIGQVLAKKYRILSMLGEGGMGRVYKAEQAPLGVEVVIKTLHPHLSSDTTVIKRFFREAQAASRLRHPNCIAVLDFGDADGTLFIAMEFLRGRSLADVLAEDGVFEPKRAGRVICQVLEVLEAAHRMNIVHRDLKPENIMVEDLATRRDYSKVLDFGIAKIVDPMGGGGTRLTQTGMVFGTPAYMAPEQASAQPLDARADLYAVGVILFELLTGRLPFENESAAMLLAAHATEPAPPIASVRADLPPRLAALIDQSLEKNPARRPQTAIDFKESLESAIADAETGQRAAAGDATRALRAGADLSPGVEGFEAAHPPCKRCGTPVPVAAKFCPDCGASTGRATPSSGLSEKFSDLRRFLPSGLVDELQDMGVRGAGEKRELVILVIDLTGQAGFSDDRQEEQEAETELLSALYRELSDIAVRHTGTLERAGGDRLHIVFGLAMTHADDAERAVTCALDLRMSLDDFNRDRGRSLAITAAIHSGTAVVQSTPTGPSYNPVGDTVSLPTRLAGAVASGKIIVTEKIRTRVRGTVQLRQMNAVRLKGRSAAVATYEVSGTRAASAHPGDRLADPPFVGRAPQLDSILRLVENTASGHAVHVTGEPGSGKSRLLLELTLRLTAVRHIAIQAPARPGVDRKSPTIARIVAALGGTADALRALGASTAEILLLADYSGDAPKRSQLPEQQRIVAVAAVIRSAVAALASRTPVTLLIDDAHLADPYAAELVRRWVLEPQPRVTLVATSRPGYPLPWEATQSTGQLLLSTLSSLDDGSIAAIVDGALAPTPAPAELRQAVITRSAGSPLMALETLRAMVDQGILTAVGGRWAITGDVNRASHPDGLSALYAARIDGLPSYARDVLACAAVIGNDFSVDLLDRIIAQAHGEPIDRELQTLTARGLIIEADEPATYRFTEQSCREAVYERLVADTRKRLHHAVAVALEQSQGASPVPEETIGDHYLRGANRTEALKWYDAAVDAALRAGELTRAVTVLRRALRAIRAKTADATGTKASELLKRIADTSLQLGNLLLQTGDLAELVPALTEGLAAAHKLDDAELITRLRRCRGRAQLALGDVDAALRELDTAMRGAHGLRDRLLLAELHADTGELYEKRGEIDRALEYMMRALELVQSGTDAQVRRSALRALTALGRLCLRSQNSQRAQRFLQQALTLAEELDDKLGAAKVLGNLAGVYHAAGDYQTAIKFVDKALELSQEAGDQVGTARQLNNLGTLSTLTGNMTAARRHYDAAFTAASKAGWREGMATAAAGRDRTAAANR